MSAREHLLLELKKYKPVNSKESAMHSQILEFVERAENCMSRSCEEGHVTASAWIVNPEHTHVLLIHHAILGRWMQAGGHVDEGEISTSAAAMRELEEETGIRDASIAKGVFDVDVHVIPENSQKREGEHFHFDVRYLFEAPMTAEKLEGDSGIKDVRWFSLEELEDMDFDDSVARMIEKMRSFVKLSA